MTEAVASSLDFWKDMLSTDVHLNFLLGLVKNLKGYIMVENLS